MNNEIFPVMVTGHRPPRLGGYKPNPTQDWVKDKLALTLEEIKALNPGAVAISGMATGTDQWWAEEAILQDIPVWAYIPFVGQEAKWPRHGQEHYQNLLALCTKTVVTCEPGYAGWKMHVRDKAMVDAAKACVAVWDGNPGGGTYATINYARKKGMKFYHINPITRTRKWSI